jgi:glycosyltransferase involved in cell wall biosynthesis
MSYPQAEKEPAAPACQGPQPLSFSVVVACNDDRVLQAALGSSPDLSLAREFLSKRGYASAGAAYNAGLAEATGDIVVFAHQDVYLPPGWWNTLAGQIRLLERDHPDWGVLGVFGVTQAGARVGHLYSTGLQGVVGQPFAGPAEVVALDEVVLILRRNAGLKFDAQLPGFHHYGTDICLEARRQGLRSFACDVFCVHNSNGIVRLPRAFWRSYFHLRRKWAHELPITTNILPVTRLAWPVIEYLLRGIISSLRRNKKVGRRHADPALLFQRLSCSGEFPSLAAGGSDSTLG